MSAAAQTAVWDADLDRATKYVLVCMADHADHTGGNIRPSIDLIAWKCQYNERQVRRIIRELEASGILVRETDGKGGRARATEYRLDFDSLPKRPPFRNINPDITMSPYPNPDISETRTFSTVNPDILNTNPDIAMSPEPIEPIEPLSTCANAPEKDSSHATKEQAKSDAVDGADPIKALPRNGAAQILVATWAEQAGSVPATYKKAVGQAQLLAKAKVTPDELVELYAYLDADSFWAETGFDLGTALSQLDKFRQSKKRRKKPALQYPMP